MLSLTVEIIPFLPPERRNEGMVKIMANSMSSLDTACARGTLAGTMLKKQSTGLRNNV
jgi:hypothetical protein